MNFNDTEELLKKYSINAITPGLERIKILLESLGEPQNNFDAFHIVGTNGKGSTGAYLNAIFYNSGYKTGFYSSPHLENPAERLLINNKFLSPDDWYNAVKISCEKIKSGFEPSYFELLTAAAFLLARENNIKIGIIEAGLGGRLDATNLLKNTVCSVIASISMDHTEYLGDTLEKIAGEKFAVVKNNIPACFSGYDESLKDLFKKYCAEAGAIPFIVSEQTKLENIKFYNTGCEFDFYAPQLELKNVKINLPGKFQVKNAALALSAAACTQNKFNLKPENILIGMQKATWPGRFEIIKHDPEIILDGGHNYDGVKNLVESVKYLYPDKKICVIYTAMRDKDYKGCLNLLNELNPDFYFTTVPNMKRCLKPEELLNAAQDLNINSERIKIFNDPINAINEAAKSHKIILICGSLYLIGFVRPHLII